MGKKKTHTHTKENGDGLLLKENIFADEKHLKRKSSTLSLKRSIPRYLITPQYSLEFETASHSYLLNTSTL